MANPIEGDPVLYTLEVAGKVTVLWDERLENWEIEPMPGDVTRIRGTVRDQSELYGVVAALRNMGLTLLRVEPNTTQTVEDTEEEGGES